MSARQRTILRAVELRGRGLHSGAEARVSLAPAAPDSGIRFHRMDLPGEPDIPVNLGSVAGVEWETALARDGADVRTAEHLLAAAHGLGIDNLRIDLWGPEPPALDGSARAWCEGLREAGIVEQAEAARGLQVHEAFEINVGKSRYTVGPYDGFRVSAEIEFDHPVIGRQFASVAVGPESFENEIAPARTFGFKAWKEALEAKGFALGASSDNTIVLSEEGLVEGQALRFTDEFVRHKILDIVGDLALVGARLHCHVVAHRPGHRGNIELARRIVARYGAQKGTGMELQEILDLLPHRYPMLLVDRVVEVEEGKRLVALKNVTANEPFFQGHFPGHPVMPGVLIVEALAQCGGLLIMKGLQDREDKVIYFLSVDQVKFRKPVVPGDQLALEVEMLHYRGTRGKLRGVARVDGQVVAEATILGQVVDR